LQGVQVYFWQKYGFLRTYHQHFYTLIKLRLLECYFE
jgi:hypothetical protein